MKKVKIIVVVSLIAIFTLIITLKVASIEDRNKAITLHEAFEIAYKEAKNWEEKAELFSMTSVDNEGMTVEDDGHDGRRRFWNFIFVVPEEEKQLIISIHDKKVINSLSEKGAALSTFIKREEMLMTSKEAVDKAIKDFKVNPGNGGWAGGYHFTLDKQDNVAKLSVVCLDKEGYFSNISFDASTKELISGLHKIPEGGGIIKNKSYMKLDKNNQISGIGIYMSPNFENDNIMIASYIVNPYKSNMLLRTSITMDNGITWRDFNVNENFSNINFSDNFSIDKTIYAVSGKSLIKTTNYGLEWENVFTAKSEIMNMSIYKEQILLNCTELVYLSKDNGLSWNELKIPSQVITETFDDNGNIYIYSNNKLFKEYDNSWREIEVLFPDNIRGVKFDENNLIYYSEDNIGLINLQNNMLTVIDSLEGVENVFLAKDNMLYYLSNNKSLIKLTKNNNEWISEKIDIDIKGKLLDLNIKESTGDIYLSVGSEVKWEKIEGGR